jgi:hypothetical protein
MQTGVPCTGVEINEDRAREAVEVITNRNKTKIAYHIIENK